MDEERLKKDLDHNLIHEVEKKKTGANVHNINEAVTNYKACVDEANGTAWWLKGKIGNKIYRRRLASKYGAEHWEKYLRIFIATGEFPKEKPRIII